MPTLLPMADEGVAEPPFQRIAVVGFGLMGASFALAVRRLWRSALVIAVDRRDVIETAMRMHAADVGGDDLIMAADADLVVLAAPVLANVALLSSLPDYLPGEAIVTDVGSTKRAIVEAARALPARLTFVGGHPLAGAAIGGIDAARPDLFADRPWILTPEGTASEAAAEKLTTVITAVGGRVKTMASAAHDELAAYLSHLPQLTASALMHVVGEHAGAGGLGLAGRGLRDTTRLASSPADIWRDIAASNQDNIGRAIDELIAVLLRIKAASGAGQQPLDATFESAAAWKRVLEEAAERR